MKKKPVNFASYSEDNLISLRRNTQAEELAVTKFERIFEDDRDSITYLRNEFVDQRDPRVSNIKESRYRLDDELVLVGEKQIDRKVEEAEDYKIEFGSSEHGGAGGHVA